MKKFFLLIMASMVTVFAMAIGRNDGSTKANAIDFDWEKGVEHAGGTKWYRVDLAPLYEEENPSLTLYLTNPSNVVGSSVDVSMQATVAGQTESKDYTIAARQYKTYTANASMLVRMKQTEIYLTLTTNGKLKFSAKVFEAADLDETCQDARTLAWDVTATQAPMYSAWWRVSLLPIKSVTAIDGYDARVTITNTGSQTVNLKVGQSLDCPSSGTTKRSFVLAPGEAVIDTIPRSMINSVQPDEIYFGIENVESEISIKVDRVAQPTTAVIPLPADIASVGITNELNLRVTDTIVIPAGKTLYRVSVADMDSLTKYEPEFTYRNEGGANATVTVKMAFERPAYGTSNTTYELAPGEEEIVVYKKNMFEGMVGVDSIYLLTIADQPINFYGRFKHVREGKACKTNIDYNWDNGHTQEARTTQWYAVDLTDAKNNVKDVVVYIENLNTGAAANVTASLAFSCPYIDLQELSRSIGAGQTIHRRMPYSSYAMMSDTVWMGIETNQEIRFWATLVDAEKKAEVDTICLNAIDFNWEDGAMQNAGDTVWYRIDMTEVRDMAAKFPTVFVQNLSSTAATTINAELSLECPDSIANEKRSMTIAANGSYSKQLSRNMFENIQKDTIYLRVVSTQDIALQVRLTEEAEGASCSSAIPFNWVSGNSQAANANLWYSVDLRNVMERGNDLKLHMENKDNASCKGVIQLSYECPVVNAPSIQNFSLAAHGEKTVTIQNSALETLEDSIIFINLQGTTALRFWADTLLVQPFDTIFADGITLVPLQWDSLYTQTEDTVWYVIPQSEIELIRNLDEKVKPVAHLINLGSTMNKIKAEAAFGFPIGKKMMTKSQEVKGNQHYSDTVPASTFEQFLKKDSIIIRVTRPLGSADFQFRAELVKAFNGNSRNDALPIRMDQQYTQSPNTEMWYKINTAELKKDSLYNKILNVYTKSAGAGDAKIRLEIYDGLLSDVDLFDEYGLDNYRERTVQKGTGRSHNIPAQAVYGLGDVELYIKVRTTDSLVFETKFVGTYAPRAVDPAQASATLVVPNVEYVLPGDNEYHWYMFCLPYIQNNYIYAGDSRLEYELNGKATIEGTATFQDNMDCAMPVRKRTINKSGTHYHGQKLLSELFNKAVEKAGYSFDISSFQPQFIDSLLHRFVTKDSVTFYIRLKSDKEIKARLVTPQITGDECTNAMEFDWEHGNVNPAGATTWYHVDLDSIIVPDTCDLRLHVENWADVDNNVQADLYFDCADPATKSQGYTLAASGKDSIDIDRDLLVQLGWADMIINYTSSSTSHIWAELIPDVPRDTLRDTIVAYVCYGDSYLDTITNIVYDPIETYTEWADTVTFQDGVVMKDSITLFQIYPLVTPEALTVDSMKKLDAAPLLEQGMQLFVDSSSVKLTEYYKNLGNTVDTIIKIDTVYWAKPVYKANGDLNNKTEAALDLTSYYQKTDLVDTLLLVISGAECGVTYREDIIFTIGAYKYGAKNDTICPPAPAVNPDTLSYSTTVLDTLNLPRYVDTIVTYYARVAPTLYAQGGLAVEPIVACGTAIDTTYTLASMMGQFEADAAPLTMKVTDAKWQVEEGGAWLDMPYTVAQTATSLTMRYVITTECGDVLNSTNFSYVITPCTPPCENDTVKWTGDPVVACDSYTWTVSGAAYTTSGTYYYDDLTDIVGDVCHKVYELKVTINNSDSVTASAVSACESYYWAEADTTITATGEYIHTFTNIHGCDSVVTLPVTIYNAAATTDAVEACDKYEWVEAGLTITESGVHVATLYTIHGCDSVVTLTATINKSVATTAAPVADCASYYWAEADTTITATGEYIHTFTTIHGCDSVVTLPVTIYGTSTTTADPVTECNSYYWAEADTTIITSGPYTHVFASIHGCDSIVTVNVTINVPYEATLSVNSYYGDRIIMINLNEINALPGWNLDTLDEYSKYVKWYREASPSDEFLDHTGYYYTLDSGEPLPAGTYYAVIEIPASEGATCGAKGETVHYTVVAPSPAPALIPSLARPGEEIKVINLDPETETIIRIYSAEGFLLKNVTTTGESTFTIQAADNNGIYLVELISNDMKSTLRYIVK